MADMKTEAPRLVIDEFDLDQEWVGQPALFFRWARKKADADRCVDGAKGELDVVKADLDANIRKNPEVFGIAKITEKVVENTILSNSVYQETVQEVIKAKHDAAIIAAAVEALQHRKRALECLVTLHGQNYFSRPQATGEAKEKMSQVERTATRQKGRPKQ